MACVYSRYVSHPSVIQASDHQNRLPCYASWFEASHGYVNSAKRGYGSPCLGLRCSLEIVKNLCAPIGNSKNGEHCRSSAMQIYGCPKRYIVHLWKFYHALHKLLTYLFDILQPFFEISSINLKFIPLKLMTILEIHKNCQLSGKNRNLLFNSTTPAFPYVFDNVQIFLAGTDHFDQ